MIVLYPVIWILHLNVICQPGSLIISDIIATNITDTSYYLTITMSNISEEELLSLARQMTEKNIQAMEHEYENAREKLFENVIESVSNSIQHATTSLVKRGRK